MFRLKESSSGQLLNHF